MVIKKVKGFVRRRFAPTQGELDERLKKEEAKLKIRQTKERIKNIKRQSGGRTTKVLKRTAERISGADLLGFGPIRPQTKKVIVKRVKKKRRNKKR